MKIDLTRFLIAGVIVSIPAIIMQEMGYVKQAWAYVGLIILALVIFYYREFSSFTSYLGFGVGQVGKKAR